MAMKAPPMAPSAVVTWRSIARRMLVKPLRRWTDEPATELVTTATALAAMATLASTPKNRVKIGTRKTPPPSPSIDPSTAAPAAAIPKPIDVSSATCLSLPQTTWEPHSRQPLYHHATE
jgi:hypothetical protein